MVGGVERVYFSTAALLEEMGHEVLYFSTLDKNTTSNSFTKYFVESLNIREIPFSKRILKIKEYVYNKTAYENLKKIILDYKPDIVHIHLFCAGLSSSILKAIKECDVPIVHTVHDYRLLCPANLLIDSNGKICEKCINKSYYQCAVKKCVDGNFFYSTMVSMEAYFRKYFIKPLDYIDHFIYVSHFSQLKHAQFDQRYLTKSTLLQNFTDLTSDYVHDNKHEGYFLFFGRLSKEKGIDTLLAAAVKSKITLKIAGMGPLYTKVLDFSKKYSNIHVLGYQTGNKLKEIIKKSYFIILPSECYENNPMTILEGYALGKPVIGSRIGGIPEIVEDNKTGFLFESKNIDELKSTMLKAQNLTKEKYNEMTLNSRSFAEQNSSAETYYKKLIAIYSNLILDFKK